MELADATEALSSLEGRTVLVTGAGGGMGRATSLRAAAAGAYVVATDVEGQDKTALLIHERGGQAEAHTLDVTDPHAWESVTKTIMERRGGLDGLANIAGMVDRVDSLLDQTVAGWDRAIEVDLKGTWLGMRAVLPHMIAGGGGSIVNTSSIAALVGIPNMTAYSASKGGVIAITRQAAVEYARQHVRVNAVAPGVVNTRMLSDVTEEFIEGLKAAIPAGRVAEPAEVARLFVYLLSPASDFITAQVIPIDGGITAQ